MMSSHFLPLLSGGRSNLPLHPFIMLHANLVFHHANNANTSNCNYGYQHFHVDHGHHYCSIYQSYCSSCELCDFRMVSVIIVILVTTAIRRGVGLGVGVGVGGGAGVGVGACMGYPRALPRRTRHRA